MKNVIRMAVGVALCAIPVAGTSWVTVAHADPSTCRNIGGGQFFDNTGTPCRSEDLKYRMHGGDGALVCWLNPHDAVRKQ